MIELRDLFASQIAPIVIRASMSEGGKVASPAVVAYNAYLYADALLEQREKPLVNPLEVTQ
jgi:hypothetical protein